MSQANAKSLLKLLKHRRDNMRGHNSLFIIITSNDSKQAFKNPEKIIQRGVTVVSIHASRQCNSTHIQTVSWYIYEIKSTRTYSLANSPIRMPPPGTLSLAYVHRILLWTWPYSTLCLHLFLRLYLRPHASLPLSHSLIEL